MSRERLSTRPTILEGSEEVDDLPAGRGEVARRGPRHGAAHSVRMRRLRDQPAQYPANMRGRGCGTACGGAPISGCRRAQASSWRHDLPPGSGRRASAPPALARLANRSGRGIFIGCNSVDVVAGVVVIVLDPSSFLCLGCAASTLLCRREFGCGDVWGCGCAAA